MKQKKFANKEQMKANNLFALILISNKLERNRRNFAFAKKVYRAQND